MGAYYERYDLEITKKFQSMWERIQAIQKPFSMVELRLNGNYRQELLNFLHNTPEDIFRRLTINLTYRVPSGDLFFFNEMFGAICIFCISEICRDNCTEGYIWPEFQKVFPPHLQKCGSSLFGVG